MRLRDEPNCAGGCIQVDRKWRNLVPRGGFEPPTRGLGFPALRRRVAPFRSLDCRLEGFAWKDRHLREHLPKSRFPHYGRIGEHLAWTNRPPGAINQPPSFKVGEANSVSIEHAEFDAHGKDLAGRLMRGTPFCSPGLSFMWPNSICANDLGCRCPRCLRLSLPCFLAGCRDVDVVLADLFSAVLLRSRISADQLLTPPS